MIQSIGIVWAGLIQASRFSGGREFAADSWPLLLPDGRDSDAGDSYLGAHLTGEVWCGVSDRSFQ